jgi:hypothetical protein
MLKPFLPPGMPPLGIPFDPWSWMDIGSAQTQPWLELQRALWQPWWDAQAQWLRIWQESWPMMAPRGAEQLA